MGFWLITPLLLAATAAAVVAVRLMLRRGWGSRAPVGGGPAPAPPAEAAPAAPSTPPAPPGAAAGVRALDTPLPQLGAAEIMGRLRALQLDLPEPLGPDAERERKLAQALAEIGDPAGDRRHFPRRPNLLPQLMHAIHDESVARRQLVGIIAGDPALVDSLLRMANSAFYRLSPEPVESIERAVAVLGSDGLRSVIATALMQPIFNSATVTDFPHFPQLVWEHALRSAQAAVVHAAVAERIEPFTAEVLSLISGLAEIVLFRAVRERCPSAATGGPTAAALIAALMHSHAASLAQRIGKDWQLSEAALAALLEQSRGAEPASPLGRSLKFGRLAGALAVLYANGRIDKAAVRSSLPPGMLSRAHSDTLVTKLLQPFQDPRTSASPGARRR